MLAKLHEILCWVSELIMACIGRARSEMPSLNVLFYRPNKPANLTSNKLTILDLIIRTVVRSTNHEAQKNASSTSPLFTSTFLRPSIFLSTRFSRNFSLCSSFNVRYQVSHPHNRTGKIIFPCILIVIYFITTWKKKDSGPKGSRHSLSSPALRFFLNAILVCWCSFQTPELCHTLRQFIVCLCVVISFFIPFTKQDIYLVLLTLLLTNLLICDLKRWVFLNGMYADLKMSCALKPKQLRIQYRHTSKYLDAFWLKESLEYTIYITKYWILLRVTRSVCKFSSSSVRVKTTDRESGCFPCRLVGLNREIACHPPCRGLCHWTSCADLQTARYSSSLYHATYMTTYMTWITEQKRRYRYGTWLCGKRMNRRDICRVQHEPATIKSCNCW